MKNENLMAQLSIISYGMNKKACEDTLTKVNDILDGKYVVLSKNDLCLIHGLLEQQIKIDKKYIAELRQQVKAVRNDCDN